MEFEENFFQGIKDVFAKEEEFFNQEITVTLIPKSVR